MSLYGHASPFLHLPRPQIPPISPTEASNGRPDLPSRRSSTFLCPDPEIYMSASSSTSTLNQLDMALNEGVDWSKHLPAVEGFTEDLHTDVLSLFFAYGNSWHGFVNEALFRRDLAVCCSTSPSAPVRTAYYSPLREFGGGESHTMKADTSFFSPQRPARRRRRLLAHAN